mmetsp:Transcript_41364/g.76539  ORF Transcript_41364/g.76539 Transcript_41364/m.76539 type:complete len:121 (+) Transcript_41364:488-850(+)
MTSSKLLLFLTTDECELDNGGRGRRCALPLQPRRSLRQLIFYGSGQGIPQASLSCMGSSNSSGSSGAEFLLVGSLHSLGLEGTLDSHMVDDPLLSSSLMSPLYHTRDHCRHNTPQEQALG